MDTTLSTDIGSELRSVVGMAIFGYLYALWVKNPVIIYAIMITGVISCLIIYKLHKKGYV